MFEKSIRVPARGRVCGLPHVNIDAAGRMGLSRVRGLRAEFVARVIARRESGGPYRSLDDFCRRAGPDCSEIRSLVRSGCLDGLPASDTGSPLTRPQALWALWHHHRSGVSAPCLFESMPDPPDCIGDYSEGEKLADEAFFIDPSVSW